MSEPIDHLAGLRNRFPYMFEGENIGLAIPTGWLGIVTKACEEIDALLGDDRHQFEYIQIKEKFGTLRVYWRMRGNSSAIRIDLISPDGIASYSSDKKSKDPGDEGLRKRISEIVAAAENASKTACIVCGQPGRLDKANWYLLTLCLDHTKLRAEGKLPDNW